MDAGASTGGFTDCLLRRGAAHVVAVDVGYGSSRGRSEPTNASRSSIGPTCATCVPRTCRTLPRSWSRTLLHPAPPRDPGARPALSGDADLVLLVKPQFEVGRERVGSGGVVRDPDAWRDAILGVADASTEHGLSPIDVMASPLAGPAGNIEFPLHVRVGSAAPVALDVEDALEEARAIAGVPS